jgi:hypothetical protein
MKKRNQVVSLDRIKQWLQEPAVRIMPVEQPEDHLAECRVEILVEIVEVHESPMASHAPHQTGHLAGPLLAEMQTKAERVVKAELKVHISEEEKVPLEKAHLGQLEKAGRVSLIP